MSGGGSRLLISVPTVVLSFLSFVSCAYASISAYRSGATRFKCTLAATYCHCCCERWFCCYVCCGDCSKTNTQLLRIPNSDQHQHQHQNNGKNDQTPKYANTSNPYWTNQYNAIAKKQQNQHPQQQRTVNNNNHIHSDITPKLDNNNNNNNTGMRSSNMLNIIFWMCVTDGMHGMEYVGNFFPQAINAPQLHGWYCQFLGIFGAFFGIQSPMWHLILAYHLSYLLLGGTLDKLNQQLFYHHLCAWLIPLICTVLPMFFTEYGVYENKAGYSDYECWLVNEDWQLMWTLINAFALIVHYLALTLAVIQWRKSSVNAFSRHYKLIVLRLVRFIAIYTLVRCLPVTDRIVEQFTDKEAQPLWLVIAHHIGIAGTGLATALVWKINQKDEVSNLRKTHKKKKKKKTKKKRKKSKTATATTHFEFAESTTISMNETEHSANR